jgi:hypothetical protein
MRLARSQAKLGSTGIAPASSSNRVNPAIRGFARVRSFQNYNAQHRWSYFPSLERNEVILLRYYDSKEDGRARFTAHSALDDPTSLPDPAPRESIEVRALVFWPADH